MIDVNPSDVVVGAGGLGGVFMLLKFFIKQGAGGLLDVKEMGARNDILEDLRSEVRTLRDRVDSLETKVGKLTDRLVVVRSHALAAYGIVQNQCHKLDTEPKQMLLDLLTNIIKED